MKTDEIILCLTVVLLVSLGQVMLRMVALDYQAVRAGGDLRYVLAFKAVSALAIYGIAMILWVYVLSRVSLATAFSFFGLCFLTVPLFAWVIVGDVVTWRTWLGGVLIIAGILVCAA